MHPPVRELRFEAFTLDLSRCVLRRGTAVLPLRPQSFDVLKYLVMNTGRVVPKAELFEAVWPGVHVTDDSLVQCIRDIRQALGDHGRRFVRTVPRRGYLLEAEAVAGTIAPPPARLLTGPGPEHPAVAARSLESAPTPRWLVKVPGGLWRRPQRPLLAAAVLVALAATLVVAETRRQPAPNATAAHHAILGRAALDSARSQEAFREGLAHYDKALALDPNHVPALLGYARVMVVTYGERWVPLHELAGLLSQGLAAAERAIRLEPGSSGAHQLRGVLLRQRGDVYAAVAALQHSLALRPANSWTVAELARAKIEIGRADETIGDIEKAIRMSPSDPHLRIWYRWAGLAAVHLHRPGQALEWALKAHKADPARGLSVPLLAIAYADVGREAEGRAILAEYLARRPGYSMATLGDDYPRGSPAVAEQRARIFGVLRRLGVPEGPIVKTGLVQ